jgi:hypothetical protein
VSAQPWTIRAFGPKQSAALVPRDTTLPWGTISPRGPVGCIGRAAYVVLPARAQLIHNAAFPFGKNDGAIWAGRGLTAAADGGVSAALGPLTVTIAPTVFATQNASFPLAPNGGVGNSAYADWRNPQEIDSPQRFGDGAYTVIDPGQSSLRLDFLGTAIGVSTENQYWGPATDHPIITGNNAAGFPHLFVGSARPFRIWRLGSAHGRMFWGRTSQSKYSPLADTSATRLASGIVAVFQPRFLPGFEIGGARFFHVLQDRFRLDGGELLRPLGALLKISRARQLGTPTGDEFAENQLGSIFFRLMLPSDAFELYGEYGREDHNWDLREFWLMPDHDAAYLMGARKAWRRRSDILSVRAEILNSRVSHLALASSQVPWYVHATVRQGHTNRGQPIGSAAGQGGGASVLAFDRYTREGRVTLSWERLQLGESRMLRAPNLFGNDVAHVWSASRLRFGRRLDVEGGLSAIYEINRHLRGDAFSLRTTLSVAPSAHGRASR